ncbi:hypothetical protein ALI144C_00350 [Actinosynnema sp. ALI-1.44]|uniref:hypothetical protein n=1 Tax=Actinosynnema sp. ALI-1.44 TaxID=1933779 RepID=UPI00097C1C1D|nr:hypothetical protein [Actinosynnema sp. ALI-1.44]ONI91972.1 hypothetical protein ALI144C_00350 [Actinosynnema sp. ALI-1.44]
MLLLALSAVSSFGTEFLAALNAGAVFDVGATLPADLAVGQRWFARTSACDLESRRAWMKAESASARLSPNFAESAGGCLP